MKPSSMPVTDTRDDEPPQPDSRYVIATLHEENRALYENKLYLLSLIKQIQDEYQQSRQAWEAERASLVASLKSGADEEPGA